MKNDPPEQKLLDFAKQTLDHSIQNLDPHTVSQLQSARQTALSHASKPRAWVQPTWALAAACLMIFTIALWNTDSPEMTATLPLEDVDVLASAEGWEFYEDLEFYSWLAEDDQTG